MRYILLAAMAAGLATPAFAGTPVVEVQGGYDSFGANGASEGGITYGATLGYELPIDDSVFFGAEVSIDNSSVKDCAGSRTAADPRLCVGLGRDIGVAARIGIDVSESSAIYGIVGYTNARVTASVDDGTNNFRGSGNADGIKLGVGFRQYFGEKAYGKIEYRYSNYEGGFSRHQGLVGVGYAF